MAGIIRPEIERYVVEHTSPEPPYLLALAAETRASTALPEMMVGPVEGRFLTMLVHLLGARRVLEIGTFTGYSALCLAEALPPGGRIITCEIDEHHAEIARRHIAASPYADLIEVRLGPALDTLAKLGEEGREDGGPFDLVFIDADKPNYSNYLDAVLEHSLLADRGVVVADNVLWGGEVLDPTASGEEVTAVRAFNRKVRADPRLEVVMLTVRDGISLIRKVRS